MRSAKGLWLLVSVSGIGGCAEERDPFVPQIPVSDSAVASEPLSNTVVDDAPPYERPDTVDGPDEATPDRVFELGRKSRALYDRLRIAGLVR